MTGLADLHRHLDGSLRRDTVRDLADAVGLTVPEDLCFYPAMGLDAALSRFAFTVALLQHPAAIRRVAAEICEDAAIEGVTTLEIRFAPQLHGGTPAAIVDAALEGIADRAGLVLCGLYGEDPRVLAELVAIASARAGVVGIDLAGGPAPGHRWRLASYAAGFRAAAEAGLGRTVHAGEGRPPAEIRQAIDALDPTRIGHATTLLDDPGLVELVVARGITIEACPSSNLHTGAIAAIADHPLPRWLDRGVKVCVCPDNTLLSDVTAAEELRRAATIPGMDDDMLAAVTRFGHQAAFRRARGTPPGRRPRGARNARLQ